MKILLLDNFDSFVYNLAQAFQAEKCEVEVRRNDELELEQAQKLEPDAIVISPGPGHPANKKDFGVCGEVLRELSPEIPTLGVCLGHQGIVTAFGGSVIRAQKPVHGKNSLIRHDGSELFDGISNPFSATRYHSLVGEIETLPDELVPTAFSLDDRQLMAVRHRRFPIFGVQFHPEAVMTKCGRRILKNFIREAGR